MARQAHHHFIPSSYLKGFTEGGKDTSQFWCVPKNNDDPFLTRPKDACSKRDYYTVEHEDSLIVEKLYSDRIEPRINIALRYIEKNKSLPPGLEMLDVLLLAATLYLRTPSHRSIIETPMIRAKEIVESMCSEIKISNKGDFNFNKTDLIFTEIRLIGSIVECLANKYYRLYTVRDSDFDVVTSDQPFILSHPNGGENFYFGVDTPNIEICVPINRKAILVGRNEPFRDDRFNAGDRFIGLTNSKLIISSGRFFFSSKPEIALIDDDLNVYKHEICNNKD